MVTFSDRPVIRNQPLRVMHVVHKFGVGGMEVGIAKLVNSLPPTSIDSSICSCSPADSLKEQLRPGSRLFELNRRRGNDPALVWQLYQLFRREHPDVVHTHRWGTLCEGLVAARLAGVPHLVHGEHGTLEVRRLNAFIQRRAWNHVDRVLSVSSRLAEKISQEIGYPLKRITVIRNGVDLKRFRPQDKPSARRKLNLPEDAFVIGTVGRLVEVKDHATFLRALAQLRDAGVPFVSLIAGKGPLQRQTESLAATLGLMDRTRFLGDRNDVDSVMAAFDVFVLSSASEGLSNTIQEAMACGLPVVATRVGGADELVDEGHSGIIVPPRDPEALKNALQRIAGNPSLRERMGAVGLVRARLLFGLDRMIREYEAVYTGLRSDQHERVETARSS
jgi:sugar transferase (PEP-CTERM/EpsH1 system associated)